MWYSKMFELYFLNWTMGAPRTAIDEMVEFYSKYICAQKMFWKKFWKKFHCIVSLH